MASWLTSIGQAVYREYDRRIRRASLVTEYGVHHGEHHEDEDESGEIANLPLGAELGAHDAAHTPVADGAALDTDLALPEVPAAPAPSHQADTAAEDGVEEGEIVNAPPGTPLRPS